MIISPVKLSFSGTEHINHRFIPAANWTVKSSVVRHRQLTCSWGCFHELTVNSSDVHCSIIMFLIYSGDIMMIINCLSKIWHFFSAFWSSLHVYNFPLPQNARDVIDLCVVLGFVNKVHFLHYGSLQVIKMVLFDRTCVITTIISVWSAEIYGRMACSLGTIFLAVP